MALAAVHFRAVILLLLIHCLLLLPLFVGVPKLVSEYDQEIPQSQTADKPMAPRGRATQPSQDTRKTN